MIAQPDLPGACDLNNPRNWRTRASVHVVMDGYHIQVDAGPDFRSQCISNGIDEVDLFILTHSHADHILGMDDMRRFCDLRGFSALPVFSNPNGIERIKVIFPYAIGDKPVVRGYPAFRVSEMPGKLDCHGGRILSTTLPHGSMDVLGLIFVDEQAGKKFVYYTDCEDVPEEALELARGADVVVLDALRHEPHSTHMHIEKAVEVALEIGAPQTYLTHLTFMVDHDPVNASLPEGIALAYDGLRLNLH